MSTHSIVYVKANGSNKLAQHFWYDGYINGVGTEVYEFLHKDFKKEELFNKLLEMKYIPRPENPSEDVLNGNWEEVDPYAFNIKADELLRKIQEREIDTTYDSSHIGFAYDYTYTIDLDNNVFSISNHYVGLIKEFQLDHLPDDVKLFRKVCTEVENKLWKKFQNKEVRA